MELPNISKIKETLGSGEGANHSVNHSDVYRDAFMLKGPLASEGFDIWRHVFRAKSVHTGEIRTFFIDFYAVNPKPVEKRPIFGKPSHLLVSAGVLGEGGKTINRYLGWDDVSIKDSLPLLVSAGESFMTENRSIGRVCQSQEAIRMHPEYHSDFGEIYWDLSFDKKIAFNAGYATSWAARELDVSDFFWHAEGLLTYYDGAITLDGEKYIPTSDAGYADKCWGKHFIEPWTFLQGSGLVSRKTGQKLDRSAFAVIGGQVRIKAMQSMEQVVSGVWYEGDLFEFNFSKFWKLTKTKFRTKHKKGRRIWELLQETPMSRIVLCVSCREDGFTRKKYIPCDGSGSRFEILTSGNGSGWMKLYRKRISMKDKWEWEEVDIIDISDVFCQFGAPEGDPRLVATKRPAEEVEQEREDAARALRKQKRAQALEAKRKKKEKILIEKARQRAQSLNERRLRKEAATLEKEQRRSEKRSSRARQNAKKTAERVQRLRNKKQ